MGLPGTVVPSTSQYSNSYPATYGAVRDTLVLLSYQLWPGIVVMPFGFVWTVKKYWVFQSHLMLDGWFIVKVTVMPVPVGGTFPVPIQPVHIYCVSVSLGHGEVTDAVTEPASNHPLVGLGEP